MEFLSFVLGAFFLILAFFMTSYSKGLPHSGATKYPPNVAVRIWIFVFGLVLLGCGFAIRSGRL
jgi:hypothetical protein